MIKGKNYLIKSINYNKDTFSENEDKISISSNNPQNKNIKENNAIIPSISTKQNKFNEEKRYNALKSLDVKKNIFNSFSEELELSFEKYNTLYNNDICCINKENIYKKILEDNKKNEKIIRPIKIIKCEKINVNKKNNHNFLEYKIKNNNSKKHLVLKTDIINNSFKDICLKSQKENKYKDKKIDNHSFLNDKYTPILSNKKEENNIILNHSITFITHKNKEKNETNKQKKLIEKNENNELIKKIEKKGYMDIKDFMDAINKENNKNKINKNNFNELHNEKKYKDNKKGIEMLTEINVKKIKKNLRDKLNLGKNHNINSKNFIKEHKGNNNLNLKEANYNEKFEELKNNLEEKNSIGSKKKSNNFNYQDKNKIKNKSLNIFNFKKDNHKLLKYKMTISNKGKLRISGYNYENNQLYNKKDEEKENGKNNKIKNINSYNETKALIQNKKVRKCFTNNNSKKNSKNNLVKKKNTGINLTRKINKYNSIKCKTFQDINNNSLKDLLKKRKIIYTNNLKDKNDNNIYSNNESINITDKKLENSDITNTFKRNTYINNNYGSKIFQKDNSLNYIENENILTYKQKMNLTTRDESIKIYNNSKEIENNQVKSCESQLISGINGPNTTYFSGFNKSDFKILNKVNFDMPINVDLEKEINENFKEENIENNQENKDDFKFDIKKNSENKKIKDFNEKDKKLEKLENFINKFNDEEDFKKERKIELFKNEIPSYGRSIAEVNLFSSAQNFENNKLDSKENKICDEILNNDNTQSNIMSNFYDDININCENIEKIVNIKNNNFFINFHTDLQNDSQDFLDSIKLIQKNVYSSNEEIKKKEENKTENETIKELETEYEFNLNEEKFCEPLQKYENNLNFDKINPF